MYVHFGQHHFGKVDVVPDLCYVATRFFHINFVPLIPLESNIIVIGSEKDDNFQGLKTTLSLKSVLVAWLRALLCVVAIGGTLFGIAFAFESARPGRGIPLGAALGTGAVAVGAGVALWLTYRFNRAGYERAMQLGSELGL